MNGSRFAGVGAVALVTILTATMALAQTQRPATSGPAEDGSPAWFLQGSFPDPGGRTIVAPEGQVTVLPATDTGHHGAPLAACSDDIGKYCGGESGLGAMGCLMQNSDKLGGECRSQVDGIVAA